MVTPPPAPPAPPTPPTPPFRIGFGYDLHRLEPLPSTTPLGPSSPSLASAVRPLVLAGVPLGGGVGCVAHSDGDALFHAVTDAILGSLALPDIGQLFPDDAPENEGRDSAQFLREAVRLAREVGYRVVNVDAVVVLERPKLAPHKAAVRRNLALVLGVDPSLVNIKGKTQEQVDAVGEGRAIEVHCVALLARSEP